MPNGQVLLTQYSTQRSITESFFNVKNGSLNSMSKSSSKNIGNENKQKIGILIHILSLMFNSLDKIETKN